MKRTLLLLLGVLPVLFLAISPARAGPPGICWPVEIGDATSLPWGKGPVARDKRYDARRVTKDMLALLGPDTPVLVRMETLRRAALYTDHDTHLRAGLLNPLMARVLDAEAKGENAALAWFDAGYLAGCYHQLGAVSDRNGYAWVRKALALSRGDASIEHACAILTLMGDHPDHKNFKGHMARASEGAKKDPLLFKNVALLAKRAPPLLRYFENLDKRDK